MAYITAALGTTRMRWALRPPYNAWAPSSAMTRRRVCIKPVYFFLPSTKGCRNRVRRTWYEQGRVSQPYIQGRARINRTTRTS